ncbi:hypothetical protein P171DRAFT_491211 [Karstenula rhodostoma CBS 690.94]|uniref:Uncharacterized protein n=1 Tax=Karstenula rhodostoma CBS 690.94 TaxID=1392251 RepID=A0A9P4U6V9_9PLEO|nr:hypothetical protein P171DRAFT_491211 [Karstenula rhodostoma CBS 690.94]
MSKEQKERLLECASAMECNRVRTHFYMLPSMTSTVVRQVKSIDGQCKIDSRQMDNSARSADGSTGWKLKRFDNSACGISPDAVANVEPQSTRHVRVGEERSFHDNGCIIRWRDDEMMSEAISHVVSRAFEPSTSLRLGSRSSRWKGTVAGPAKGARGPAWEQP